MAYIPVGSAARLSTLKVVTPPETSYSERIQLGMVSDLSVHLPDGQVGAAGMLIAKALAANAATAKTENPMLAKSKCCS